ncbi:TnsA-like heteromeric transposase endonuclease subunit, partial [Kitasatospora nipponensis]|uniref:TnsA-like heteromeric transposase endonuclease subunit n=1 Tax=Kitasatospora nipponensis TaxID=258049 RepID=UPI0031DB2B05
TGTEHLVPAADATTVPFEDCLPARDLPSYPGIRHTPGSYWAACCDAVLDYESYLESKWMRLLDFDHQVKALSAQPFLFEGADRSGKWRHTPDLFVRRTDGSALLLDVKNPLRIQTPRVLHQARRTASACELMGWDYQMVGEPDPQLWATVEWLGGYRRPLNATADLIGPLLDLATDPVPGTGTPGRLPPDVAPPPALRPHPPAARPHPGVDRPPREHAMNHYSRITVEDWVEFEDERHQVTAIDGSHVRLRSVTGHRLTIMLSELLTDPSFRSHAQPPDGAGYDDTALGLDPGGVVATPPG